MPKIAQQKLTDTLVKSLKPKPGKASYPVFDAGTPWPGLYIEVFTDGAKRWRYVYTNPQTGKQSRMGLACIRALASPKQGIYTQKRRRLSK